MAFGGPGVVVAENKYGGRVHSEVVVGGLLFQVGDGQVAEEELLNLERGISPCGRVLEEEEIVSIIINVKDGTFKTDGDRHSGTLSTESLDRVTESGEGLRRWLPACSSKKL
jgi:hypothetical protein